MRCPFCGKDDDKVVDSRSRDDGRIIKRRRLCLLCERRFSTIEEIEDKTIYVIKADGRREDFDRKKLMKGIQIACNKRPVSINTLDDLVSRIEIELEALPSKEIKSIEIGEKVSFYLKAIDEVAYVRFASVYRKFQDKEAFIKELNLMNSINGKNK
ncbi:transcriptional repressor NrdR [bacterium]|nr:transcriptional repressor NrdR [bacterium]